MFIAIHTYAKWREMFIQTISDAQVDWITWIELFRFQNQQNVSIDWAQINEKQFKIQTYQVGSFIKYCVSMFKIY